ncbi:MAG: UvrD-helicase domain-containing protein [Lachnospiraceae bacterium]|nr:UvrD-helicase domain-containing protein [Lachnospiraceae bacterium]
MGFTKNQEMAIRESGQNILVSAAAGSGKTAVLVERIIRSLVRKEDPADIDRILVMTFTKAAAGEMRDRILKAINAYLRETPEGKAQTQKNGKAEGGENDIVIDDDARNRLYRQATLIHNAHISTIHGFCLDVIRAHFHRIDLSPDFRAMDDTESKLMKADVLQEILEEAYETGDTAFLQMCEHIATGKSDDEVEEAVLRLFKLANSHPDVDAWLDACLQMYEGITAEAFDEHPIVKEWMQTLHAVTAGLMNTAKKALETAQRPDGPQCYCSAITSDIEMVERLLQCQSFTEYAACIETYQPERLASVQASDPVDQGVKVLVQNLRNEVKKTLCGLRDSDLKIDIPEAVLLMKSCRGDVSELIRLTRAFRDRLSEKKRSKNLIDFNDMEHYCLQILKENPGIAEEYRTYFKEIYVDEYQDSNLVQETIVNLIADGNVFNVGDVKQSIYKFRLARPDLFLHKYDAYAAGNGGLRIDLHDNFRSRPEVIDAVNEVFASVMCKELGGIDYDENAALKFGAPCYKDTPVIESAEKTPGGTPEESAEQTQCVAKTSVINADYGNVTQESETSNCVDPDGQNQYVAEYVAIVEQEDMDAKELEASYIATRIHELIRSQMPVYDKRISSFRPVRYSDIVILLRTTKGWDEKFCSVITSYGIPIHSTSSTGYFTAREIVWLLSFLQVVDNPLQDIPLAAVLLSPLCGLSDTDLALIRARHPKMPLYQSLRAFCEEMTDPDNTDVIEKTERFLSRLEEYKQKASYLSVYEILQEIIDGDYGRVILSSPGGQKAYANLNMLLSRALDFEKTSYRGLFQFVRYIEYLKKHDFDYGEANLTGENEDTVRLMSIHKSKGLEFPVVFIPAMHKGINYTDANAALVLDSDLGIGLFAVNSERRIKQRTFGKNVISKKLRRESLAEEIRVLYVGMTRAREKLIMTGMTDNADKPFGKAPALMKAQSYRALLAYASGEEIFHHIEVKTAMLEQIVDTRMEQVIRNEDLHLGILRSIRDHGAYPEDSKDKESPAAADPVYDLLKERLAFSYPVDVNDSFGKISVTELKKRSMQLADADEYEDGEKTVHGTTDETPLRLVPKFLSKEAHAVSPTGHGTAFHRMLEIWDYTIDPELANVKAFFEKTAQTKRMEEDLLAMITPEEILTFLQTDLAKRMRSAALRNELYREQPFVIGLDTKMLVQGIIDAFFIEDGQIVVVDYKTDRVHSAQKLIDSYHIQLEYYGQALWKLMKLPVKELLIYSAQMNATIPIERSVEKS